MIPPAPHDPNDPATLVLRRTLRAPRERVFRAWIDPAALERWLKPQGMHMTVAQLDARVGGAPTPLLARPAIPPARRARGRGVSV